MFKLLLTLLNLFTVVGITFATQFFIEANSLSGNKQVVIYKGNVKVKTDKGDKLTCDLLTVYLNQKGDVEKIIAIGHVVFEGEKYSAVGKKMTYYPSQGKVVLEGNAVVKDGKGVLKGQKIIYFPKSGKIVVKNSVSSVFVIKNSN